jgi:biotin carboxyl carrier protein
MKYSAIVQGQRLEIELKRIESGRIEAEIDGRSYKLQGKRVEPGIYWFNWNHQSLEIGVTESAGGYAISLSGERIDVEIVDARTALRRAAQHGHTGAAQIRAPMPGIVVKLLVAEGAEVRANQGILVVEAMKMQNEIQSPKKGVVRKLEVAEGAAVTSGDLLATVE